MQYYVTIRNRQGGVSLALGPFPSYHDAYSRAPAVKGFCENTYGEDAKGWLYGVDAKMAGPYPPGKLNGCMQ
jgi:hypothetical protein